MGSSFLTIIELLRDLFSQASHIPILNAQSELDQLEHVGMIGQWATAILQTAGLYAQSNVLNTYGHFIYSMGALIFTFCVFAAVVHIALHGNYGQLVYLIIGPGLFLWMLTFRIEVCSTRYQFGESTNSFDSDQEMCDELKEPLLELDDEYYGGNARVSWFFATFDNFVSYIVERTVSVLTPTENYEHFIKLARERVILRLVRTRASNPQFLKLLSIGMAGQCSAQFSRAVEMATIGESDSQMSRIAEATDFDPTMNSDRYDLLFTEYQLVRRQPVFIDQPLKDFLSQPEFTPFTTALGIDVENPLTCDQLWQLVIYASYLGAEEAINPTTEDQDVFPALTTAGLWEEVIDQVREKLLESPYLTTGSPVMIPGVTDGDDARGAMILASFYLRNAITFVPLGAMTVRDRRYETYDEAASRFDFAQVARHEGSANMMDLVYFSAYVPYIQGILLYFLSATFPFFAVFLLIPGRQSSFALWMSLWAWVKSWDIGFAMVHVLRDVIWTLLPSFAAENTMYHLSTVDFTNPASVLAMVFQNDPISQLNTYFFIVSMFMIGVPAVTAQMFAGASQVYGAIRKGGLNPQTKIVDPTSTGKTNSTGSSQNYSNSGLTGNGSRTGISSTGNSLQNPLRKSSFASNPMDAIRNGLNEGSSSQSSSGFSQRSQQNQRNNSSPQSPRRDSQEPRRPPSSQERQQGQPGQPPAPADQPSSNNPQPPPPRRPGSGFNDRE